MGTIAARKAVKILENTENVLAIEILTACQAIDFRGREKLGKTTKNVYRTIRKFVPVLTKDRTMNIDIAKTKKIIKKLSLLY
jgi:histidine ammonia-lyase